MDCISIYDGQAGMWLADDECTWTSRLDEAAQFSSVDLAKDIAIRERKGRPVGTLVLLHFVQSV